MSFESLHHLLKLSTGPAAACQFLGIAVRRILVVGLLVYSSLDSRELGGQQPPPSPSPFFQPSPTMNSYVPGDTRFSQDPTARSMSPPHWGGELEAPRQPTPFFPGAGPGNPLVRGQPWANPTPIPNRGWRGVPAGTGSNAPGEANRGPLPPLPTNRGGEQGPFRQLSSGATRTPLSLTGTGMQPGGPNVNSTAANPPPMTRGGTSVYRSVIDPNQIVPLLPSSTGMPLLQLPRQPAGMSPPSRGGGAPRPQDPALDPPLLTEDTGGRGSVWETPAVPEGAAGAMSPYIPPNNGASGASGSAMPQNYALPGGSTLPMSSGYYPPPGPPYAGAPGPFQGPGTFQAPGTFQGSGPVQSPGPALQTWNERGFRADVPLQRGVPFDTGQDFPFEVKKKEYPSFGEILKTGRYFFMFEYGLSKPYFNNNSVATQQDGVFSESFQADHAFRSLPRLRMGFESRFGPGFEIQYSQFDQASNPFSILNTGTQTAFTAVEMAGLTAPVTLGANSGERLTVGQSIELHSWQGCVFKEVKLPIARINGLMGLRYVSLAQQLQAQVDQGAGVTGFLNHRLDFRGYGPHLGLEYYRPVGHTPLEFLALANGSLLLGNRDQFVNRSGTLLSQRLGVDELVTPLQMQLGIQYRRNWAENRSFYARLTYDTQTWWNAGAPNSPQDDLGFRGIGWGVGLNR